MTNTRTRSTRATGTGTGNGDPLTQLLAELLATGSAYGSSALGGG